MVGVCWLSKYVFTYNQTLKQKYKIKKYNWIKTSKITKKDQVKHHKKSWWSHTILLQQTGTCSKSAKSTLEKCVDDTVPTSLSLTSLRPLLAKWRSLKANITCSKCLKILNLQQEWTAEENDMKNQKNKKWCKNALKILQLFGKIQKNTYWCKIHQFFLQTITNNIQPLAKIPCINCREL